MKTINKIVFLCVSALFLFTACDFNASIKLPNDPDSGASELPPETGDTTSDVDFTSHSDYALIVKNNAQKNMVLFKGEPSQGNILGGVKAGDTTKLKKDPAIFSTSSDYIVYVVTEENYTTNKENLSVLDSSPYATFYAVYNTGATNENTYEISSLLNGAYSITINNGTRYNVELRNKGPYGETVAFVLNNTYEKKYHLGEGEYMLFPVFRKYDKRSGEILSTFPTYKTGQLAGEAKSYEFSLDSETTERQFDVKKWADGVEFTPSAAYIEITNNADQGLQFFLSEDGLPLTTSAGGKRINTGKSLTYAIDMKQLSSNTYQEEVIAAGYRVGTNRISDIYLNGDKTTSETYKAGHMYFYTVTGDAESGYKVESVKNEDGTIKASPVDWSTLD